MGIETTRGALPFKTTDKQPRTKILSLDEILEEGEEKLDPHIQQYLSIENGQQELDRSLDLEKALFKLEKTHKSMAEVIRRRLDGETFKEIADSLNVSITYIKKLEEGAAKKLRDFLENR